MLEEDAFIGGSQPTLASVLAKDVLLFWRERVALVLRTGDRNRLGVDLAPLLWRQIDRLFPD
jgi:hypothetical protein